MQTFVPVTRRAVLAMAAATSLPAMSQANAAGNPDDDPPPLVTAGGYYTIIRPSRLVRSAPIRTVTGEVIELARFRGRVVLLNFWATWCAPCVREMPSLDRLAAEVAGGDIAVVPVSLDKAGTAAVVSFYREHRLTHLDMYFDTDGRTVYGSGENTNGAQFALYGLPISYVIDGDGCVRGYVTGAVEWDSQEAKALLRHYLRRGSA